MARWVVEAKYAIQPGLYDDLYMDLTFVDVIEKYGMDAPVDSFANAFANAGYMLWHANQAARYNILNGNTGAKIRKLDQQPACRRH